MNALLKKSMTGLAAVAACAVALPATAQSYGYPAQHGYGYASGYETSQPYYDQCVRDRRQRQVAGGVVGAIVGLAAGRGVASRGVRSEGGALGAVLGAAVGAGVGGSTAACEPGYAQPYGQQSYGQPYPADYGSGYGYDDRYDDRYRRDYGYDDRGYAEPVRDYRYENTDQCRLVESNIRLPDGRVENRYVRACPDGDGRYRVVD